MKLITRDTDYALRALCFIAKRQKRIISVSELVRKLKIPRPFLRKILQVLNRKRLLRSYRGQDGGFMLALPPNRIFLVDLITIFQGPISLNRCVFKKGICPDVRTCVLRKKMEAIEKGVVSKLKAITIKSLLH